MEDILNNSSADSRGPGDRPSGDRFVPTRHELQQIAVLWMGVLIAAAYQRATGSDGPVLDKDLAADRLRRLSQVLSGDAMATAFAEAERRFVRTHDDDEEYEHFLLAAGISDPGIDRCVLTRETAPEPERRDGGGALSPDVDALVTPIAARGVAIGHVDAIVGAGGELVPDYDVTRPELIGLIEYWASVVLDFRYWWFRFAETGSTDIRLEPYARRRIDRIADVVTEDEVCAAVERAKAEFSADIPMGLWQLFLSGAKPERNSDGFVRWPQMGWPEVGPFSG